MQSPHRIEVIMRSKATSKARQVQTWWCYLPLLSSSIAMFMMQNLTIMAFHMEDRNNHDEDYLFRSATGFMTVTRNLYWQKISVHNSICEPIPYPRWKCRKPSIPAGDGIIALLDPSQPTFTRTSPPTKIWCLMISGPLLKVIRWDLKTSSFGSQPPMPLRRAYVGGQ